MSSERSSTPTERASPDNLGILLREPFRIASARLHERFAERGHPEVRAPHGNVLQFLESAGTRVSVLAERAQMTKQSMAELVAHLERHGYVERVRDPDDRRAKLVRATARGDEVYEIAREFVKDVEAEWTAKLGERKIAALRRLLKELNEKL
jgi:DNA-binding MarR family transcriptional regulator